MGAASEKMWHGHMQYGEIVDDLAKIGGREFVENNEIRQEAQHCGGSEEKGVVKMRAGNGLRGHIAQKNGGTFKCNTKLL